MKRKDEICYEQEIYYADFDNGSKICSVHLSKILEIRRVVKKGGHVKLKWVYLPHSKMGVRRGHHILLFCYILNRNYHNTPY